MLAKGRGGVESMAVRYHEALRAEGYDTLSVGHPEGVMASELDAAEFSPLATTISHDPVAAWKLWRQVQAFKPDLILMHGNRATGLCLLPFVNGRAKTVQVLHNQCYKRHIKRVSASLCVSANVSDGLGAAYPQVPRIEVANFAHLESHPVKTAPDRRPVIGAMGRLHEIKRFDLLLKSAAILRNQGHDFLLRIAGDGPERENLQRLIEAEDLSGCVELCGWVSDPHGFMAELDLFVVSSRYEAFGLVVIEAMAAGVPVVSADIEGPREILRQGSLGTLFESENEGSLAEAVGAVFADWKGRLRMARLAQHHALKTFGFEAGRQRLSQALETIRHRSGRGRAAAVPVFAPIAAE